jgi:UDP-N-acetylmuramyl pentapeptide phosphotransferase/UDP-N-acetylglucosamine-1-phosphate transferase
MIKLSELNWEFLEIFYLLLVFIVGLIITYTIMPYIMKIMKRRGYVGVDIHKNSKPEIPESGGLGILIGLSLTAIILSLLFPSFINEILIFTLTVILSGLIGYLDDRIRLRSRYKVILTIFTGTIIFVSNLYGLISIDSPTIPYLGKLRLTVIYPFIAPIIVAVFANTVNMLEGYNGEGSGTSLIALIFLLICSIIWDSAEGLLFTIISLAVIIPFFIFNKFPSKTFPGDVGTLSIGAIFAGIALFGALEAAVFCALLVHVFNSFYILYSVKGFFESKDIQETKADIILLENNYIKASDQKDAALTLPRLILAKGTLKEPSLVNKFFILSIIAGLFSIITTLFMKWTLGSLDMMILLTFLVISGILITLIMYFFKRIRGIIALMTLLMIAGYILLFCINLFIMPITVDINVFGLIIPTNILISLIIVIPCLILWYYLSIKYFWIQIGKMPVD